MLKILDKPNLPKEFFGLEVKPALLSQAVRVYLANQRQGNQSALTRAEVARTRRKVFKQKGTGHARHGDRKSPIFVGGGIAFAPKPRDYSLSMNSKMKDLSKKEALSLKVDNKELFVISGMDKLTGKTAELAKFLNEVGGPKTKKSDKKEQETKKNWLLVTDINRENVWRAGRNIKSVEISPINLVNTYQLMQANMVLMMEEAILELEKPQVTGRKVAEVNPKISTKKNETKKKTVTKKPTTKVVKKTKKI